MGIQEDVEALKRIPLFAKVEPAKLKLLAFAAERAEYQPGEALFHQGDQADPFPKRFAPPPPARRF